jgi:hypothetical protein
MNYFANRDEKEKRLTWSAGAGGLGDDVWTKVLLPFLFFSLFGIPSVRPQFVLCLPVFFFFPWFPFCSSPGRCLRFPVSHGFLCFLGFSSFVFPLCSRPSSSFSVSFNPSSVLGSFFFFGFFSPPRWLLRGFF